MNVHLFVYGTLLSHAGHAMGARLRRDAQLIGPATMAGRLYNLGRYPGLVEAPERPIHGANGTTPSLVHGEVYALKMPAITLRWLDAYEGVLPLRPDQGVYARVERLAWLNSGATLRAWVYVYLMSVRPRQRLADGRWPPPQV
ncbi:MAG TPA: gamma-glutamylcyclotransferase family protein [Hyphomicrobiaceae bacterium]|nr:gamma-glutamylcyclotransferase family protein [Hyphomicrobiaceae bacterium]